MVKGGDESDRASSLRRKRAKFTQYTQSRDVIYFVSRLRFASGRVVVMESRRSNWLFRPMVSDKLQHYMESTFRLITAFSTSVK